MEHVNFWDFSLLYHQVYATSLPSAGLGLGLGTKPHNFFTGPGTGKLYPVHMALYDIKSSRCVVF